MDVSSRTPEGVPNRCPVCGKAVVVEPSDPARDAPCPHCGHLLWFDPAEAEIRKGEITVSEDRIGVVVKFSPDCPILERDDLQRIDEQLFDRLRMPRLVLDFSNVAFISSEALGKLITVHQKVKARDGWIKVRNLRPRIRELFSVTRLDRLFEILQ